MCDRVIDEWDWFGARNTRARCPHCRSLDRHRHLALLLDRLHPVLERAEVMLEYGPHEVIHQKLCSAFEATYVGLDISRSSRRVDVVGDGCALPFADASVDFAVCFHVLEHIPDDVGALHELRRVLGRGGIALIQSPWRRTALTDEDPGAPPEERAARFGFKEHVRLYGSDIDDRLVECGFRTTRLEAGTYLSGEDRDRLAIGDQSTVWVCRPASDVRSIDTAPAIGTDRARDDTIGRLRSEVASLRERKSVRLADLVGRTGRSIRRRVTHRPN